MNLDDQPGCRAEDCQWRRVAWCLVSVHDFRGVEEVGGGGWRGRVFTNFIGVWRWMKRPWSGRLVTGEYMGGTCPLLICSFRSLCPQVGPRERVALFVSDARAEPKSLLAAASAVPWAVFCPSRWPRAEMATRLVVGEGDKRSEDM
jgi:hypothetical protein